MTTEYVKGMDEVPIAYNQCKVLTRFVQPNAVWLAAHALAHESLKKGLPFQLQNQV